MNNANIGLLSNALPDSHHKKSANNIVAMAIDEQIIFFFITHSNPAFVRKTSNIRVGLKQRIYTSDSLRYLRKALK